MKTFVCSSPSPSLFFVNNHHSNSSSSQFLQLKSTHQHNKVSPFICLSSSTSFSSSVVDEQQDSPPPSSSISESFDDDNSDLDAFPLNFSGCKACGREEIERGCNGDGRIQGGIATVPGFGWWPIKAYRPCPGFVASGGNYRRRGQSMDEVAFGGGKGGTSMDDLDELSAKKKGKNRRQFKG
ncbi:uncharacterized protein LOC130800884 isoform X3 [Amaranthus tricolor]|uniref:uncharacterized protein LOC130800884 isoform X3 n=1 Tax=Amaranthus tricolor TaxID=29722 RepID=UPI002583C806|nr:uncharacterized protein LOC130800884 isoform X3 [Amaranthus tricolor]